MSAANRQQLGLVGLGQFGRFALTHLEPHFDVIAHDIVRPERTPESVQMASLAAVAAADFVLLATPVQQLREVLETIAPHLRAGTLVIDVCSVKERPMQWLAELLPADIDYLGSHPLFGPNSAAESLEDSRIVLCPGRGDREECVAEFLRELGLYVIITDAETHDRESATGQALAQYVGRAMRQIADTTDTGVTTYAAELMREIEHTVADDSWELFEAIQRLNPYADESRAAFRASLDALEAKLKGP